MEIIAFGLSDTGRVRSLNEDSLLLDDKSGLFVVADGMGGHNCGEVASRMAVGILQDNVDRAAGHVSIFGGIDQRFSFQANLLASAIRLANRTIYEAACSCSEWHGMGTTIAAVLVDNNKVGIAHVGDSRVYLLREGCLQQITADHSVVAEQLRKGLITTEEANASKQKNIITRALGHEAAVEVDLCDLEMLVGDRLLICSDGLTGMVTDQEIAALIQSRAKPQLACRDLVEQANARGGLDNITALLIYFDEKNGIIARLKKMLK